MFIYGEKKSWEWKCSTKQSFLWPFLQFKQREVGMCVFFFPLFDSECTEAWISSLRERRKPAVDDGRHLNVISRTDESQESPPAPHDSISSPSNTGGSKLTTSSYVRPADRDSHHLIQYATLLKKHNFSPQAYVSTHRSPARDSQSSGRRVLPLARRLGRGTVRSSCGRELLTQ